MSYRTREHVDAFWSMMQLVASAELYNNTLNILDS